MNPILPLVAGVAALFFFRRPTRKIASSTTPLPSEPEGDGEGTSPPPRPGKRPRPVWGKGKVTPPGKPKPKPPGGMTPDPDDGPDPPHHGSDGDLTAPTPTPPPPGPFGPGKMPGGKGTVPQEALPEPSSMTIEAIPATDEEHEVPLVGFKDLPDGTYYVRLALTMQMQTSLLKLDGATYTWDHSITIGYGQREAKVYRLRVQGNSGTLELVKKSQKKIDARFVPVMFNCGDNSCGWNGTYNSFFEPELVWRNGLEAKFRSREVRVGQGINRYTAKIDLAFERKL